MTRRWIHTIGVTKVDREFIVGRSVDADIPLNDITNDEQHAKISVNEDNQF